MERNLDGVYFRVCRDEQWRDVCFSDLTEEEMDRVMAGRSDIWLRSLCVALGKRIKEIGDELDLVGGD